MFVLISPIRKSWAEDTGRRVTVPVPGPVCSPSRSTILGVREDEYVGSNGHIYRTITGTPTGVHLSVIHAKKDCQHLTKPGLAPDSEVIEISPDDLSNPLFKHLPCCRVCGKFILRSEPIEMEKVTQETS